MAKKSILWLAPVLILGGAIFYFFQIGRKPEIGGIVIPKLMAQAEMARNASPSVIAVTPTPTQIIKEVAKIKGTSRSFGDNFSGEGYIDRNQTDMALDYNVTSYSFPPLFELKEDSSGDFFTKKKDLCLEAHKNCLTVKKGKLFLDDKVVAWPKELENEKVQSVNVHILSNAQENRGIVGIVTGEASDERGWVYFFNGREFTPLITDKTSQIIKPAYRRLGGLIYFGGNLDDFLILYSGYDGIAFYNHAGNLQDISRFFGLRVMGGGFQAMIVRAQNTRGSVFYICSEESSKFKLIKLWSVAPGELIGAVDFSYLLHFPNMKTAGCVVESDSRAASGPNSIGLGFKDIPASKSWIFTDKGFDNSKKRQVTSVDIAQKGMGSVLSTIFSQIGVYSDPKLSGGIRLSFSNTGHDWQGALPFNWYEFRELTPNLYWRAEFLNVPGDADYSPWLDHINEIIYKTEK